MDAARRAETAPLSETDLRLLRIFRTVAECGGLTAAEHRLHMERSTISRHIKLLEEKLGGRLCLRGPAGFELTDFGHAVMVAAIRAADLLDRVREDLDRARNALTGDLHVGLADNCLGNPSCRVRRAIERMGREAPGVRLHLAVGAPADLERDLAARKLHLCIAGAIGPGEALVRRALFEEEFRLYARRPPAGGDLHLGELAAEGYAVVTRSDEPHSERLAASLPEARRSQALGLESVAMLLGSGRHLGFLPTHYAAMIGSACPLDEVRDADHLTYASPFFLSHERDRPLSAPGRLFRDIVLKEHRPVAACDGPGH